MKSGGSSISHVRVNLSEKDISFVRDRIIILAFEVEYLWRRSAESDAKTNAARSVRMLSVSISISQQLFVCEPFHIESERGK